MSHTHNNEDELLLTHLNEISQTITQHLQALIRLRDESAFITAKLGTALERKTALLQSLDVHQKKSLGEPT